MESDLAQTLAHQIHLDSAGKDVFAVLCKENTPQAGPTFYGALLPLNLYYHETTKSDVWFTPVYVAEHQGAYFDKDS